MTFEVQATVTGAFLNQRFQLIEKESTFASKANFLIASLVGVTEVVSYLAISFFLLIAKTLTLGLSKTALNEHKKVLQLVEKSAKETEISLLALFSKNSKGVKNKLLTAI